MKKHLHYAIVFLLFLTASCVSEKIETQEDRISYNPEAVWEYNGDISVLNNVIQELKSGPNREKLERRLLKNDVLWEESKFIIIDNKKRILVPFLSIDKDNVIGVLSLVKDAEGETTFDMTVRKDLMSKSVTLPFWKRGVWAGYFMALDKDILGIKNGSPGLVEKLVDRNSKVKNNNSKTMQTVCGNVPVREICITYSECDSYDGGETWVNCVDIFQDCYYEYDWRCWEEPDNCPQGYEMDENGNCVPIVNQTCASGYEMDENGNCVPIDDSVIFNGMTFNTFDDFWNYTNVVSFEIINPATSPISKTTTDTYTYLATLGVDVNFTNRLYINIKQNLKKASINQNYSITEISTEHTGFHPLVSFTQGIYNVSVTNSIATVDYTGSFAIDIIHKSIGKVQSFFVKYRINLDINTGHIISVSAIKINQ